MRDGSNPLEREFLPLPIAALVAYYKVTDLRRRLPEERVGETVRLMAMALAALAPIYGSASGREETCVLSAAEVDKLLAQPLGWGAGPELDDLCIRKADMERGIQALKTSGNWSRS